MVELTNMEIELVDGGLSLLRPLPDQILPKPIICPPPVRFDVEP